jgi:hypothetical protein
MSKTDVVTVEAFDVLCEACGTRDVVDSGNGGLQTFVAAHQRPVLHTFYARLNGGPVTVWRCSQPKPLR